MNLVSKFFGPTVGIAPVGADAVPEVSRRSLDSAGAVAGRAKKTVVGRKRRNAGGRSGVRGVEASKAPVEIRLRRGDASRAWGVKMRAL